jgi:hypothetical protein
MTDENRNVESKNSLDAPQMRYYVEEELFCKARFTSDVEAFD